MNMGALPGVIGHYALVTNKLVDAGIVFGHGVSSLVCGAVAVTVTSGCCALGGLSPLGMEGSSSPWNFIGRLGISWILLWARLYTIIGIGVGLAVVAAGFAADIWVDVTVVVTAIGVGSVSKVGFMGKGCAITHLEPSLYGCFGSLLLLSLLGYQHLSQQRAFVMQIGAGVWLQLGLGTKLVL